MEVVIATLAVMMNRIDALEDNQITIGRALRVMAIELVEDFDEIDFGEGFSDFKF